MSSSNLPPFMPNTTGFTYTEPPQPEWIYRQGIEATADGRAWAEGQKAGWKTIDTATEDPRFLSTSYWPRRLSDDWNVVNCMPPSYRALFLVRLLLFLRYLKMGLKTSLRSGENLCLSNVRIAYLLTYRTVVFLIRLVIKPPSQHGRKTNHLLIYTRCLAPHP